MNDDLVEMKQLVFSYKGRLVLNDINIQLKRGKITAIMGPSGSGKTTLLRLIGALLTPDQGHILVNGQDIHRLPRKALYAARQNMGMLFQNSALFTHLSVFDNVAFALREHSNLSEDAIRDIVLTKLELVGLRASATQMPGELSGGMARRVALARAIALDPSLIMYDEPFTGQDPIAMGVLMRLIKRINQLFHTTTVMVSHDVAETCAIADYIYLIHSGGIIESGTPLQLQQSNNPVTRQFMCGEPYDVVSFCYPDQSLNEELFDV